MKIGIFDSGLGGLIITHSLIQKLPSYDYLYLGDTARVPYGNRSQETVYRFTEEAVDFLFKKDCKLIVLACNTASAEALRKIQQEYLLKNYPDRRVLGVIIPTVEVAVEKTKNKKIGVLGTLSTINSESFIREIKKICSRPCSNNNYSSTRMQSGGEVLNMKFPESVQVFQQAAPLLVPLIENQGIQWASSILDEYLKPLLAKNIDTLILGCTHYPAIKDLICKKVGSKIQIISQDEIISVKLEDYLKRHPEIEKDLTKNSQREFLVTDLTENIQELVKELFDEKINLKLSK